MSASDGAKSLRFWPHSGESRKTQQHQTDLIDVVLQTVDSACVLKQFPTLRVNGSALSMFGSSSRSARHLPSPWVSVLSTDSVGTTRGNKEPRELALICVQVCSREAAPFDCCSRADPQLVLARRADRAIDLIVEKRSWYVDSFVVLLAHGAAA
jgi:hypothetical protein